MKRIIPPTLTALIGGMILLLPVDLHAQTVPGGGRPSPADPAQAVQIDLDLALRYALDQSWRMERLKLDLQRDQFNLEASRAGLKSNANMNFTIPNYDQSIKEITDQDTGNPRVISTRGARYQARVSIRQPLPTDGVVSLNGQFNRTQDMLFSYTPGLRTYNSKFFVRFEQPLLKPNGIQMDIRRAELRLERTELRFVDQQIDIINDVSRSYFGLYERTYQTWLANEEVQRLERAYTIGRRRFQAGSLTEVEVLQLDIDLADRRDRASSAEGRLTRKKSDFKQDIGMGLDEEVAVDIDLTYTPVEIDKQLAVRRALEHRTEVRQNEISREFNEMDLKERRSWNSIQGTISLTLGLEGRGEDTDQLYDAFMEPDQTRGAAINFRVPLWDWGRNKAQVNSKLTELEKVERSLEESKLSIERDVRDVVDRVGEAQQRLELLVSSVEAAERSFRLSLGQFESGSLGVQDLILIQNRFADARSSYLNAYLDYRRALIDLMRRTYWDWERDQPLIDTLLAFADEQQDR
ncbi:MAG: TolC family protein [bacterium]